MRVLASSFADPADVVAFKRCKAKGGTDQACFKVGDNGIGCWGDNTAQEETPMCALPPQEMEKYWGSVDAAKHKKIEVSCHKTKCVVTCILADRMPRKINSSGAQIDLNPAACKRLMIKPPILTLVDWLWL